MAVAIQGTIVNATELSSELLADPSRLGELLVPLESSEIDELVEHLKSEADRHRLINANHSLEYADLIVRIGEQRGNPRDIALGTMARGDALKFLGQMAAAWAALEEAGKIYQAVGDEVG